MLKSKYEVYYYEGHGSKTNWLGSDIRSLIIEPIEGGYLLN